MLEGNLHEQHRWGAKVVLFPQFFLTATTLVWITVNSLWRVKCWIGFECALSPTIFACKISTIMLNKCRRNRLHTLCKGVICCINRSATYRISFSCLDSFIGKYEMPGTFLRSAWLHNLNSWSALLWNGCSGWSFQPSVDLECGSEQYHHWDQHLS